MKLGLFNILITLLLLACSTGGHIAPIQERKQPPSQKIAHHVVSKGETLYAIAWRYGLDVKTIAQRNGLSSPYTIFPGQKLSLWTSKPRSKPPRKVAKSNKSSPKTVPKSSSSKPKKPKVKTKAAPKVASGATSKPRSKTKTRAPSNKKSKTQKQAGISWRWPAKGRLLARFSGPNGLNKGIDIAGNLGEPVVSAAAGRVVYAGNGLRGYGLLLIIKHNEQYLSAYAHNNKLRVKEGDIVKGGQRIADIGSSGANRMKLHFEIRKNGKSVNPLSYLPKR
ncbi:peptidoglycan DD-metalloendopeptidase family protein [Pseudoteredinibacter isoporae]|uniref:Lipoprotein NlpD n=1 Tax=Pseudoteredinibacter isoporae TaxID=570281 RepID=A0A7X0JU98_9GAMM|nr:peptidoglycan DD-metalloendopeptidase family protein [Pseudoteredinibacter isoporae]MBB6521451.1 lipoprotein NlpD [Pseudoteredinibacter isoporae]NHO87005.1 peptidoglycan DD-metalloendopeptidase family protein [Pseudoteredinibacter isoporae]NIB24542.1 peptidoglycan DD-metalloendopeptidase family protein [Pseudoteredinibacter isoporae]